MAAKTTLTVATTTDHQWTMTLVIVATARMVITGRLGRDTIATGLHLIVPSLPAILTSLLRLINSKQSSRSTDSVGVASLIIRTLCQHLNQWQTTAIPSKGQTREQAVSRVVGTTTRHRATSRLARHRIMRQAKHPRTSPTTKTGMMANRYELPCRPL